MQTKHNGGYLIYNCRIIMRLNTNCIRECRVDLIVSLEITEALLEDSSGTSSLNAEIGNGSQKNYLNIL
jgi:hypothetical protein